MFQPTRPRRLLTTLFAVCLLGLAGALVLPSTGALAFEVAPLPAGNLITNPWFRSQTDPNASALDGWTDAAGLNADWSTSQKESNPSPDIVISGVCGQQLVYCGTSARLSLTPGQTGGVAEPFAHAYLYQVVAANPLKRHLKFFAHWVSHIVDPAEVTIYGGQSQNGPWTPVWTPFHYIQPEADPPDLWTNTGFLETTIDQGYSYYKVEIHARLPGEELVGFKMTGVYFSVASADGDPIPFTTFLPAIQAGSGRGPAEDGAD
ncbi:MAG: hypothetical protein ACRDHL_06550 [Candidatus Promineifilaceae bacterium]